MKSWYNNFELEGLYNMKKSTNNIIIEFLGLIIGCMFMGVGLNMFFKPYTIAPGGLSGLSLVISKFTGLSVSTIMLLIGIPLLVFSIKILGKKDAIKTFITNLKQYLISAGKNLIKTITTAIIGPVVDTITKVWIFLKQGYKSLREAIDYVRNSKKKPFKILMLEVCKIIIAGLTAGGAIILGEVKQKVYHLYQVLAQI